MNSPSAFFAQSVRITINDVGTDLPFGYQLYSGGSMYGSPVTVGTYSWDGSDPPTFST